MTVSIVGTTTSYGPSTSATPGAYNVTHGDGTEQAAVICIPVVDTNGGQVPTSVTYGGITASLVGAVGTIWKSHMYFAAAPSTSSPTLTVVWPAPHTHGALYSVVLLKGGGSGISAGSPQSDAGNSTDPTESSNIAGATGQLIIDCLTMALGAAAGYTCGQTQLVLANIDAGVSHAGGISSKAGASTKTTWHCTSGAIWSIVGASFAESGGGGGGVTLSQLERGIRGLKRGLR